MGFVSARTSVTLAVAMKQADGIKNCVYDPELRTELWCLWPGNKHVSAERMGKLNRIQTSGVGRLSIKPCGSPLRRLTSSGLSHFLLRRLRLPSSNSVKEMKALGLSAVGSGLPFGYFVRLGGWAGHRRREAVSRHELARRASFHHQRMVGTLQSIYCIARLRRSKNEVPHP